MVSLRSVWWCRAAFCCSAIATAQWNCSGGSQGRLLSASFWRGLHLPVYLGLWPVLGLTAQHVIFVRIWRFGASKPEKISGPQAHVTGVPPGRPGPGHFSLFTTAAVFGAPIGSETDDPHAADLTMKCCRKHAMGGRFQLERPPPITAPSYSTVTDTHTDARGTDW